MANKQHIAVLGGGMGSLSAVYALMADPANRLRYDITVYQQGWRLGGKGASGVNPEQHHRIEEHGLHVFLGFYHRALALMRRCYQDLVQAPAGRRPLRKPGDPLSTFEQAFEPHNQILLYHKGARGWKTYPVRFPQNRAVLGLNARRGLLSLARWLAGALGSVKRAVAREAGAAKRDGGLLLDLERAQALVLQIENMRPDDFEEVRRTRSTAAVSEVDGIYEQLAMLEGRIDGQLRTTRSVSNRLQRMLEYYRSYIALGMVNLRGMWSEVVFAKNGFDNIDGYDYIEWLKKHGAARTALDSPLALSLYELAFSKPGSGGDGAGFAAGVVLKSTLRMLFDYEGAFMWKMQAGMGDTVFAPMYQVLKQWGVRFEFFHQVEALRLSPEKDSVEAIEMQIQARTHNDAVYEPLMNVNQLACWPSRPDYHQLEQGELYQEHDFNFEAAQATYPPGIEPPKPLTLRRGEDFDTVLLGLSVASLGTRETDDAQAYRGVCAELFAASAKWRTMLDQVRTVATQALQIWLQPPPASHARAVIGGFEKPFQTSMDMSHLLKRETWPDPGPRSVVYFCGPLDADGDGRRNARSHRERARDWLFRRGGTVLPRTARQQGAFDPDALYQAGRARVASPEARFDQQYFRVNDVGSERYVLSVPGSPQHRLPVEDAEFRNLYLSGDWVQSDVNAGCIEACVAAGFDCAQAISGKAVAL